MIFVAFLRGLNVAGKHLIRMADLKNAFESFGVKNAQTIQAAGNVIFESTTVPTSTLTRSIESGLSKRFGYDIPTLLRTIDELNVLVRRDPFKSITITPATRIYVSFLPAKPASKLPEPFASPDRQFLILEWNDTEVCSVIDLSRRVGTVDLMRVLEREFGKGITTRSWGTILKCVSKTSSPT